MDCSHIGDEVATQKKLILSPWPIPGCGGRPSAIFISVPFPVVHVFRGSRFPIRKIPPCRLCRSVTASKDPFRASCTGQACAVSLQAQSAHSAHLTSLSRDLGFPSITTRGADRWGGSPEFSERMAA